MTPIDFSNLVTARYDEFQSEAVGNLLADFKTKREGRFLLVIPTGGGKTFTAVKAVNKLFSDGVLDPERDRVFWGAHRKELITQAKETFEDYAKQNPQSDFGDLVEVKMMGELLTTVKERGGKDALVIIDEAHHAIPGNKNYGELFSYPDLGILGLTATPSRHDGEPLDFDKESYSIGFPDLVERQIILSPEIHEIKGGRFEGISPKGNATLTGLDNLNDEKRDDEIVSGLLEKKELYKKIIIYVGGKKHVKDLHARIKNSPLAQHYESVDYILGGNDYSGNDSSRDDFIGRIKEYERAIIINCDVLTEGYDDPKVNTVVMAAPTRSKLVYMQAIGRCIRVDKNDLLKKAYIVEVEDDLPNVRYRINNRWLFSEISDTLEPAVEDRSFSSAKEFKEVLTSLWAEYDADTPKGSFPEWEKSKRYSVLFFKYYAGDGQFKNLGILIDNDNRTSVSSWFNFLSERMARFTRAGIHFEEAMSMARASLIPELGNTRFQQLIYEAMESAQDDLGNQADEKNYWITFVSLRFKAAEISNDLLEFLDSTVNRDQLIEQIKNRAFRPGDFLVRLPLPLEGSIGMIVSSADCGLIKDAVNQLGTLRSQKGSEDHSVDVNRILEKCVLPIPPMYLPSLTSIVREDAGYFFQLD